MTSPWSTRSAGVTLLILLAVTAAACGGTRKQTIADNTPTGRITGITTTQLEQVHTAVLTTTAGYPLYMFVPDQQRAMTCSQICLESWPAVIEPARGHLQLGPGVRRSLLGTLPGPDGHQVVTYNRWPLYAYVGDIRPDASLGQAIDLDGGYWYLIAPDGHPIEAPA